jgi:hypothetical protein
MKFGYEYEHIWMAVNDNNPLYGSFGFTSDYTNTGAGSPVADNYWADFLFGMPSSYALANYFVAHLRSSMDNVYAQDDWRITPKFTLNYGMRWEYGSPYSEENNYISNFDPVSQTVLTITPGAVASDGITPFHGGGVYGSTLVNPDFTDFGPRVGFAYAPDNKTVIHGGFGISYIHYTRAGSGDILGINAPQAQFASVGSQAVKPSAATQCPAGAPATSCFVTIDQGFPASLTVFNKATDNITYIPKDTKDSYVESYFLSVQRQLAKNIVFDVAYVGNHGVKLQGFLNANQKDPQAGFARPFGNWPSDITAAVNAFYSHYDSLQARYEQRFVGGLTLLNSFTWQHSLDNASASLEGNTPSPQDGNHISADYSQSDYNLPIANVTSLVYELPFGRGRTYLSNTNGFLDAVIGGWQVSGINTMQAGTPFNITYSPSSANQVSQQITASYRGANLYRPDRVPDQPLIKKTKLPGTGYVQYINYAAFVLPPTKDAAGNLLSPFGNASRNPGRTPAFYQTDLALNKKINLPVESMKLEFRTEFYNLFNHTNYYLPSSGLGGTLGTTTSTFAPGAIVPVNGIVTSTFEPRIIQFGLKLTY